MYGEDGENKGNARKWCRLFKEDGTNVRDGNEVSALLWLWMAWKRKWIQRSGKLTIHNFWITRIFSRRVSISGPRNCYGMAEMLGGDLLLWRRTKAGPTIFQVTIYTVAIWKISLTLILRRSRTGTVWFYTSTSNKRAARPKLYTKSLTGDLKLMYSSFKLVRISINV